MEPQRRGGAEAVAERALADDALVWHHAREGKRTALFEDTLERRGGDGTVIRLRRVLAGTERYWRPLRPAPARAPIRRRRLSHHA